MLAPHCVPAAPLVGDWTTFVQEGRAVGVAGCHKSELIHVHPPPHPPDSQDCFLSFFPLV